VAMLITSFRRNLKCSFWGIASIPSAFVACQLGYNYSILVFQIFANFQKIMFCSEYVRTWDKLVCCKYGQNSKRKASWTTRKHNLQLLQKFKITNFRKMGLMRRYPCCNGCTFPWFLSSQLKAWSLSGSCRCAKVDVSISCKSQKLSKSFRLCNEYKFDIFV